ncbi:Hypothetical Protein FCC1311_023272 [Hondaea fermentalgiana]|uniref:Uncharacterized protein n=1 Tax=Hondaea fermentalgiana TaxID=2315210 RepID=A0A2R5G503_9STRA|nr:Hypothetical Protein FCC1311_023272 [Hondaea fermentalgiana]|eukprot:GBG26107.1 Hypothetical Protein FCC1311_023272 [Hondaea fermentalgiana]
MYTTKEVHKMAGVKFLGGGPQKKQKESERFTGKQMSAKFPKSGNVSTPGVLFSILPGGKPDPYGIKNSYLKRFPPESRKQGFGSGDAPKHDEFMNGQRADQHKNALEKSVVSEKEWALRRGPYDAQISQLESKLRDIEASHPDLAVGERSEDDYVAHVPKRLYDIGRNAHTEVFLHDGRDNFYSHKRCARREKPRHVAGNATTSMQYGKGKYPRGLDKITIPGVMGGGGGGGSFLDHGHLQVGDHHH